MQPVPVHRSRIRSGFGAGLLDKHCDGVELSPVSRAISRISRAASYVYDSVSDLECDISDVYGAKSSIGKIPWN